MQRFIQVFFLSLCLSILSPLTIAQDEMVSMVLEMLRDPDADNELRGIFFEQIRSEAKGPEATKAFADALPTLPPEAHAGMIRALADRGDTAAKPAILAMLKSEDEETRIAAVRAIAKLGDTSDCKLLVDWLTKAGAELDAAKTSLIQIQGDGVTKAIAQEMASAPQAVKVALIEILASRRAICNRANPTGRPNSKPCPGLIARRHIRHQKHRGFHHRRNNFM